MPYLSPPIRFVEQGQYRSPSRPHHQLRCTRRRRVRRNGLPNPIQCMLVPSLGPRVMKDAPAYKMIGLTLDGGWTVGPLIPKQPGKTGGLFSCGYELLGEAGHKAFLKALDYSRAFGVPDQPRMLQSLTTAFIFERDILRKCVAQRMDRIVQCIGDGSIKVDDTAIGTVDYLIFETADRDLRAQLTFSGFVDTAWKLRALHHIATGLRQLHAAEIAHQDLKPSNILVFDGVASKIADLGCASVRGTSGPTDHQNVPGDPEYAPPEILYGYRHPEWHYRRLGHDSYMLGSMITFLFTGVNMTTLLFSELHPTHRWRAWSGSYSEVLAFVKDAFERALEKLAADISDFTLREEIVTLVRYLCEPDLNLRGHPLNRRPNISRFSLERFVSRLDSLATRAELRLR